MIKVFDRRLERPKIVNSAIFKAHPTDMNPKMCPTISCWAERKVDHDKKIDFLRPALW